MAESRVELDRALRRPRLPVEILADEIFADEAEVPAVKTVEELVEALPRSLAEAWRMGQCAASQGVRNNPFVESSGR